MGGIYKPAGLMFEWRDCLEREREGDNKKEKEKETESERECLKKVSIQAYKNVTLIAYSLDQSTNSINVASIIITIINCNCYWIQKRNHTKRRKLDTLWLCWLKNAQPWESWIKVVPFFLAL